jgi:RHS repeat-associated protein
VYGQGGELNGEYDSTGKAIREYVWLGSTPVAVFTPDPASATNPPLTYFIHADHIDTPRIIVDKSNNLRWRWLAEPFGTTAPENNPAGLGAFTFNLRFPGQYFDQATGLNQNWFRDYDAGIGRYAQSDPIGLNGGINTYAYAGGNPLSGMDPTGLFVTSADAACRRDPEFCAEIMGVAPKPPVVPPVVVPPIPAAPTPTLPAPSPAPTPQPIPPAVPQAVPLPPASAAGAPTGNNCPEQCDPPKGTVCYMIDLVPPSKPHFPIPGSHYHLWQMNQAPNGKCFWNKLDASRSAPPGAIPCPFSRPPR